MSEHYHTYSCIEADVEDMGDDGDGTGYHAWEYFTCKVTGESHQTLAAFQIEELGS